LDYVANHVRLLGTGENFPFNGNIDAFYVHRYVFPFSVSVFLRTLTTCGKQFLTAAFLPDLAASLIRFSDVVTPQPDFGP